MFIVIENLWTWGKIQFKIENELHSICYLIYYICSIQRLCVNITFFHVNDFIDVSRLMHQQHMCLYLILCTHTTRRLIRFPHDKNSIKYWHYLRVCFIVNKIKLYMDNERIFLSQLIRIMYFVSRLVRGYIWNVLFFMFFLIKTV